jgi:hypothetical protein
MTPPGVGLNKVLANPNCYFNNLRTDFQKSVTPLFKNVLHQPAYFQESFAPRIHHLHTAPIEPRHRPHLPLVLSE